MEVVALVALAVVILAVGIRVGMLVAPRVERMADRLAREALAGSADTAAPAIATAETKTTEPGATPPGAIDRGDA